MEKIKLTEGGHNWEKLNSEPLPNSSSEGFHDIMKCLNCGITGVRYGERRMIYFVGVYSTMQVLECGTQKLKRNRHGNA